MKPTLTSVKNIVALTMGFAQSSFLSRTRWSLLLQGPGGMSDKVAREETIKRISFRVGKTVYRIRFLTKLKHFSFFSATLKNTDYRVTGP